VRRYASLVVAAAMVLLGVFVVGEPQAGAGGTPCQASSPPDSSYTVTVCITQPVDGSVLSGTVQVSADATSTGVGIQRVRFYLDGLYLLLDYEAPYTFQLPTAKFVDGAHVLSVETLNRDGFVSQQASVNVTFQNGVTTPPVNGNHFTPTSGRPQSPGDSFVLAAAGDGASGESSEKAVTDQIASWNPNMFLYLGDVYEKGSPTEFYNWYGTNQLYGQFRSITNPAIGNHEYSSGTAGYFDYWDNVPHYYSFNAAGWHFVSLDSTSQYNQVTPGTQQYDWLVQDLNANTSPCTLVFFHHPYLTIGPSATEGFPTRGSQLWSLLASKGVTLALTGHDHDYQRWMAVDANGNPSSSGITEIVVGSGGHGTQGFIASDPRVVASNGSDFGALRLEMNPSGAAFRFATTSGSTLDSGSVQCTGTPADTSSPTTPTNVTATVTGARVDLNWRPSLDNVGVTGYDVLRNGVLIGSTGPVPSYSDSTADARTSYTYSIRARDAAGNVSSASPPITATTMTQTTLFSDGFESGDLSAWTAPTGLATENTDAFSGAWAAEATSTGAPAWAYRSIGTPQTQLFMRERFKIKSLGSNAFLQKFRTATGGSLFGVYVSSTGKLSTRNDVWGASLSSSTVVSAGDWHDLQVSVTIAGASGSTAVWLDGAPVPELTRTANLGTTPVGRLQIGDNSTARSFDILLDGIAADTQQIGDDTAPTMTLGLQESSSYEHVVGNTIYYSPTSGRSGSFTVTADAHDTESGVASVAFPTVFGNDAKVSHSSPFVGSYGWDSSDAASGPNVVSATNGSGLSSSRSFIVVPDTASPYGGSLSNADGFVDEAAADLRLSDGTDAGAGVKPDSDLLQRSEAPLSDGVCGSFGEYTRVTDVPTPDYLDTDVTSGHCYRYRLTVSDFVGNVTSYDGTGTTKVDAIAPSVALTGPASPAAGTVAVSADASDAGGSGLDSVTFREAIAGSTDWHTLATMGAGPYTVGWDTTSVADGLYDVQAIARDAAGNQAVSTQTVQVSNSGQLSVAISTPRTFVNAASPNPITVTATSPDNPASVELDVCSNTSLNCASGSWVSLGTATAAPYAEPWPLPADGTYALRALATNGVGDTAQDIVNVVVDRTAPSGGSVSYADGWNTTGSVAITTVDGTDAGSGLAGPGTLQRDDAPINAGVCGAFPNVWSTVSSPDQSVLSGRCYRYRYTVSDNAGNSTTSTSTAVVEVDTLAPGRPAASAQPSTMTAIDVSWSAVADNVSVDHYIVRRDGSAIATVPASQLSVTDNGLGPAESHTYTVQAVDVAGNASLESAPVTTSTFAAHFVVTPPDADSYVNESKPTTNYGTATVLRIGLSPIQRSYLRFTVPALGGPITHATLRVFANTATPNGVTVSALANPAATWTQTGITYQNGPAPTATAAVTVTGVTAGTWVDFDVTSIVSGSGSVTFVLATTGSRAVSWASAESGANAPVLLIDT
jgi:Bacterial Ig domain/Calcineurin-like phosphoesterase